MRMVRTPVESRFLLCLGAILVPRALRPEWRMEWEGELWWWISSQTGSANSLRERLSLAVHSAGAITDGLCLRFGCGALRSRFLRASRGPFAMLAAGMALLAVIGLLSGGFSNTRRALGAAFATDRNGLAILSQTGPFMGQRIGVPPLKVEYWDRHSQTLEGAAVYAMYRSVIGPGASRAADESAAKIGARFFSILHAKPLIGSLFDAADEQSCRHCAVVSYEFWKQRLGGDRAIAGRVITVDGRPFRVIGVLAKDFWFFGERPAAWSLFDEDQWPGFAGHRRRWLREGRSVSRRLGKGTSSACPRDRPAGERLVGHSHSARRHCEPAGKLARSAVLRPGRVRDDMGRRWVHPESRDPGGSVSLRQVSSTPHCDIRRKLRVRRRRIGERQRRNYRLGRDRVLLASDYWNTGHALVARRPAETVPRLSAPPRTAGADRRSVPHSFRAVRKRNGVPAWARDSIHGAERSGADGPLAPSRRKLD